MVQRTHKLIRIDLNQFKLHLCLTSDTELTFHFDSPSRKFYLSIIGLVAYQMKKQGRITSISLKSHLDAIQLFNKTVGASAGSSKREHLLPRIYRKWKDALPDLEKAPLFKVVGRKKKFDDSMEKVYAFSEAEKDKWANLFEYTGSHENVRLRFSIDRVGVTLDNVIIIYCENPELTDQAAWQAFISHLKEHTEEQPKPEKALGEGKIKDADLPPHQPHSAPRPLRINRRWALSFVLTGIVLLAAGVAVWKTHLLAPRVEVASVEKMAFPLPDKPSIVVLPFVNLSGDAEQDYFSDGMTDDLITDLSKISGLFVIGRYSTFTYKGKPVKFRQVAEDLGVRYVFKGSVRNFANTVRINAQLIDAISGECLWAERYDEQIIDIFPLQDKITQRIVETLAVRLTVEEQHATLPKKTDNLEAYLALLKGWQHYRNNPDEWVEMIPYLERAIELDPNYWHAYAGLAKIYFNVFNSPCHCQQLGITSTDAISLTNTYLKKAMKGPTPLAHTVAAEIHIDVGNFQESLDQAMLAVQLDPNDPSALFTLGLALVHNGRPEDSLVPFKKAMRLDPFYQEYFEHGLGIAHFFMFEFERAAIFLERSFKKNPGNELSLWYLIHTYAHLGRQQAAEAALEELCEFYSPADLNPNLYIAQNHFRFKDPNDYTLFENGLRKAGMK